MTVTVVSECLMNEPYLWRYAYVHLWVSFKFLSWNILPGGLFCLFFFFFQILLLTQASLNSHVVYRDFADPHTNLHASYFRMCPG